MLTHKSMFVRYPYYALNSMSIEVKPVTWLRYNMWIPLYPVGLALECEFRYSLSDFHWQQL